MDEAPADVVESVARERVGSTLRGKWRLDALIGVGGMAAVYAATHRNGLRGAVKVLHPQLAAHRATRQRFLREGYVANSIEHRGVVRVLDDDVDDVTVFLVMDLLEGEDLESIRLAQPRGRLATGATIAMASQLLDVLSAAHEVGVVHRDLKPDNVFLSTTGVVKVLDFGIARARFAADGQLTESGLTMGTPAYMPPEQAAGERDLIDAFGERFQMVHSRSQQQRRDSVKTLEVVADALALPVAVAGRLRPFGAADFLLPLGRLRRLGVLHRLRRVRGRALPCGLLRQLPGSGFGRGLGRLRRLGLAGLVALELKGHAWNMARARRGLKPSGPQAFRAAIRSRSASACPASPFLSCSSTSSASPKASARAAASASRSR